MNENHQEIRQKRRWGSYGKDGKGPLRWITIKDIHDDHLANIIPFIINHNKARNTYSISLLQIMIDEQEYRKINKIKVPFTFG